MSERSEFAIFSNFLTERNLFFRKFDLVSDLFYPMFTTSLLKEKEITKTCPPRQPSVATPQEGN